MHCDKTPNRILATLLATGIIGVLASNILAGASVQAQTPEVINLTSADGATLTALRKKLRGKLDLSKLLDADPKSAIRIPASDVGRKLEFTLDLGGEPFTVQRVILDVGLEQSATEPGSCEFFARLDDGRFTSLRLAKLQTSSNPQEFALHQTAMNSFVVRVSPPITGEELSIRSVAIFGYKGSSQTQGVRTAAKNALDALSKFNLPVEDDELSMLKDVMDGRFDDWTLAEAALLASGVTDRDKRKAYLAKINALEAEALQATAAKKSSELKALELLRLVHGQAMTDKYQRGQYRLDTLLDRGTYNCLSSTVLYNHLAERLGMDMRAIGIPNHVFSILYRGPIHVDFETTPTEPGVDQGFQIGRDVSEGWERRRELDGPGVAAGIYAWRANEHVRAKRDDAALVTTLLMLGLDPEDKDCLALAAPRFQNWLAMLSDNGKFELAFEVLSLAGTIPGAKERDVKRLREIVTTQWINKLLETGRFEEAFQLCATTGPNGKPHKNLAYVLQEWLQTTHKTSGPEKADELVGRLLKEHAKLREVEDRAVHYYDGLARKPMESGDWAAAWKVYEMGLNRLPSNRHLKNNGAYVIEQWSKASRAAGDWNGATSALEVAMARFSNDRSFQARAIETWNAWGTSLIEKAEWGQAAAVYRKALQRFPDEADFKTKLIHCLQREEMDEFNELAEQ